jgi:histidine ammonia-lyase
MALALEAAGLAVATVSALSERRLNRLMNPVLSNGLPAFLTKGAGMYSGLMLTQYTAGSLVCENRVLTHPASTGSIPAAADQEDFVSMGMTTAIKTRQILTNSQGVLAIELIAAAQALDFRGVEGCSPATRAAHDEIRRHVAMLTEDRPTYNDMNRMVEVVRDGSIIRAVEKAVGKLD